MDVLALLSNEEQMTAKLAVIVYDGGGETRGSVNPIVRDEEAGDFVISPGDALTRENLEHLSLALSGGAALRRQVWPQSVLLAEQGIVAWWRPATRRAVFFETRTAFDAEANAKDALHPPLVFIGRPGGLSVYALPESERPTGETKLLRAPYYNLYGLGAMCEGNVPLPEAAHPSRIAEYESAFFDSSFVHTNLGGQDLTTHPGGHNALWRSLIASDHGFFPFWALVPLMQGEEPLTLDLAVNLGHGQRSLR